MRIHVLRHVPFEGPGLIADWAAQRGHELTEALSLTEEYPPLSELGLLVLMGGPMAADDHVKNPWLPAEKHYVAQALSARTPILGVCLGAQILAEVAGGVVRRNEHSEIGWFPVALTPAAANDPIFSAFPDGLVVGHWHGDTFVLPEGTSSLLASEGCANQAFSLAGGRAVGLQFHLEWTEEALGALVEACGDELESGGRYVSTADSMRREAPTRIPHCREALFGLLDRIVGTIGRKR